MKIVFSLALLLIATISFSQNGLWCITDPYDDIEVEKDPTILDRRAELEDFTRAFVKQKNKSDEKLIIPIVFHVLHKYGNERISVQQCERAVEIINQDFSAQNNDLSEVTNEFKDIIGNTNIEFRLARIDPNGECTNGVVYYETDLTYKATNTLKNTIKNWNPSSYLNVWSVASIESGAAAWSHYPGISASKDGVVSIHSYIGSTHTLTHEIGHYLNLIHPWGSTNEPELDSNCDLDDNVSDTPNTIGTMGSCNLNQESCGSLDNVQNIMDYGNCDAMLTVGQVDRMRAALSSSISSRNNLWTEANLSNTGTQDGYTPKTCAPLADFSSEKQMIYQGNTIQFYGFSSAGKAEAWNWEFENGSPSTSGEQNPEISFNTPGEHEVTLKVSNDNGQSTLVREKIIRVIDTLDGIIAPVLYDMEDVDFPNLSSNMQKHWQFENEGSDNWEAYDINGNTTFRILNSNNIDGNKNSVITPNINLADIENPEFIYFDWAYAQRQSTNLDELKVYVSNNAGKNWILRYTKRGKALTTNNEQLISQLFVPNENEWETGDITLAYNKSDDYIMLKFEMTGNGGNALYIDNLKIGDPSSGNSISLFRNLNLKLYPNPTSNNLNISFNRNAGSVIVNIYNVLGKIAYTKSLKSNNHNGEFTIDLSENGIGSGLYIVELLSNNQKNTKRLIVQ